MATLTEVAYVSRNVIKYSGVVLVAYIFLQAALMFGIQLYRQLNPPPPQPPSMGFGYIPALKFPNNGTYTYTFNLQTPDGKFPIFPDRTNVFYVPPQKVSLFAYAEAEKLANSYRFYEKSEQIGQNLYQWQRRIPQPLTLKIDSVTGAFVYEYQWQADTSLLADKRTISEDQAYQMAASFVNQGKQTYADINLARGKLSYYKASGSELVPALSLSEADFIKVDYYRNDIESPDGLSVIPVVTHKPQDGIISITISKSNQSEKQIIAARFDYTAINYLQPETYPLSDVALAWEKLKVGQAYIASNNNNSDQIAIRRIELAYFDPPKRQEFFQPVYVFRGDKEFVAYVPAISDLAISK